MTKDRPDYLIEGERARLFPVLSETSKEGRITSITLATLGRVRELAEILLGEVGQRIGKTARIECYTEICFPRGMEDKKQRPDGLIVVKVGNREWRALVEAKVGANELDVEQVTSYLELARLNNIDAVITISNQHAVNPMVHPVEVSSKLTSKVSLNHWSWMHILATCDLLISQDEVADDDQRFVVNELRRFLTHDSTGLKGFDQMPPAWTDLIKQIENGGNISAKSDTAREVVEAWYQESRDLALILSRKIARSVELKLTRSQIKNHDERLKSDLEMLAKEHRLETVYEVPDTAGLITLNADIKSKAVTVSMRLRAPEDRQSTKARLSWLMRQLQAVTSDEVHIRLFWPGRGSFTQHSLSELRAAPDRAGADRSSVTPHSFEVCMVRQLGKRFEQRRNFISDLENIMPSFYVTVGQRLKAFQPSAPRVREDSEEANAASEVIVTIREAAEEESRADPAS